MEDFQEYVNIGIDGILRKLEQDIIQYDKIILLESLEQIHECEWELAASHSNRKTLILSTKQLAIKVDNLTFRQMTKEEAEFLLDLSLTYEFSDKFAFVPKEPANYPSLQNFVATDLLSREELLELLLS